MFLDICEQFIIRKIIFVFMFFLMDFQLKYFPSRSCSVYRILKKTLSNICAESRSFILTFNLDFVKFLVFYKFLKKVNIYLKYLYFFCKCNCILIFTLMKSLHCAFVGLNSFRYLIKKGQFLKSSQHIHTSYLIFGGFVE